MGSSECKQATAVTTLPRCFPSHLTSCANLFVFNGPYSPQILNEDMDEETLREVFKECLRDAPDNTDKAKAAASAGLFSRFLHGGHSRNRMAVSEEDILQAAHYIVERFGTVPEDDGDEDFDGDGGMVRTPCV